MEVRRISHIHKYVLSTQGKREQTGRAKHVFYSVPSNCLLAYASGLLASADLL